MPFLWPALLILLGWVSGLAPGRRRNVLLVCVALLYAPLAMRLPYQYDGLVGYDLGPYWLRQPIRPYFMVLRPLAVCAVWAWCGMLYLRSAGVYVGRSQIRESLGMLFIPRKSEMKATQSPGDHPSAPRHTSEARYAP